MKEITARELERIIRRKTMTTHQLFAFMGVGVPLTKSKVEESMRDLEEFIKQYEKQKNTQIFSNTEKEFEKKSEKQILERLRDIDLAVDGRLDMFKTNEIIEEIALEKVLIKRKTKQMLSKEKDIRSKYSAENIKAIERRLKQIEKLKQIANKKALEGGLKNIIRYHDRSKLGPQQPHKPWPDFEMWPATTAESGEILRKAITEYYPLSEEKKILEDIKLEAGLKKSRQQRRDQRVKMRKGRGK